jgi:hypothetical protein
MIDNPKTFYPFLTGSLLGNFYPFMVRQKMGKTQSAMRIAKEGFTGSDYN